MPSSASIWAELEAEWAALGVACEAAGAAPLSKRRMMLAVLLVAQFADRLFAATEPDGDILAFRTRLAATDPTLALVLSVAAMLPDGPQVFTEPVAVPLADYAGLEVEDFMVSLYDGLSVQRLRIVEPGGSRHEAHAVLDDAVAALGAAFRTSKQRSTP